MSIDSERWLTLRLRGKKCVLRGTQPDYQLTGHGFNYRLSDSSITPFAAYAIPVLAPG